MKTMSDIFFYDTSSLLIAGEDAFQNDKFLISSITLKELELIKTGKKSETIKFQARLISNLLERYSDKYEVVIHTLENEQTINNFPMTNDMQILSDAIYCNNNTYIDRVTFVTNDLCLYNIANLFFGNGNITSIKQEKEDYRGFRIVELSDMEMAKLYEKPHENTFELLRNQYLVVKNAAGEVVDALRWDGNEMVHLTYSTFNSKWFGKVKPFSGDIYQAMLADSLANNQITLVKGPAGSGKTYLSLAYLLTQLEKGKIDKIIVFCNTLATKDSAKLGFYPGSRNEKLLDSQIGNLLASKLGGRIAVEQMVNDEKLILLPLSDIRGFDTSGMNAGIYISEAQNMSISLMKLTLQRIGEDSICIIDGDCKAQVDDIAFEGNNNGMKRVSEIFRGQDYYGEIELQNIHRSKIAQRAELL